MAEHSEESFTFEPAKEYSSPYRDTYSTKRFTEALAPLLTDKYADELGYYTIAEFLDELRKITGKGQEYLRLIVRGKRPLVLPDIPEAAAQVLSVSPHYFKEYRRWWVDQLMDERPELFVRVYDMALDFTAAESTQEDGERD
jgi:hypothetical protein